MTLTKTLSKPDGKGRRVPNSTHQTRHGKEMPTGSKFSRVVERRTTTSSKEGPNPELSKKRTKNIDIWMK